MVKLSIYKKKSFLVYNYSLYFYFGCISESMIILWKQKESSDLIPAINHDDDDIIINKEHWNSLKVLRGHIEDVNDLSWSLDSNYLASSSLDNSIIFWNVDNGKKMFIVNDFTKGFPQGVTWDPLSKYVASIGSDRFV